MLKKSTFREIKSSLGRYLAILAIVALGVGFFAGLKVTQDAMVTTTGNYLSEQNFFDYRVLSTLGLEDEDVKTMTAIDGVKSAEGSVSTDALYHIKGEENDSVMMFHSIPGKINRLILKEGRMPEKANEVVVDHSLMGARDIGSVIVISTMNDEDRTDMFACKEYVVTGTVVSPLYLNFERGTTSLGNGTVSGFAYLTKAGFDTDYYTEVYVDLNAEGKIYSEEYEETIAIAEADLKAAAESCGMRRYEAIREDAMEELAEGQAEYDENWAEYISEKADAEKELDEAWAEIVSGRKEITDGYAKLDKNEKELKKTKKDLAKQKKDTLASQAELKKTKTELTTAQSQLAAGLAELATNRATFEAGKAYLPAEQATAIDLELSAKEQELSSQKAIVDQSLIEVESGLSQIATGLIQINSGLKQISEGFVQIKEGRTELKSAEEELTEGEKDYFEAKAEAEAEFADAEAEFADARLDLAEAKDEIDDIEMPDTYLLDRLTNVGYACFESDSAIVDGIAKVFPIFFFLVAALVCMTTMTRMVDEQRTQIGVLKALGYSNFAISAKYLFYSGSAALIGCIIGFFGGCYLFPKVIWIAYGMMYDFSGSLVYILNPQLGAICLAVALLCSMGATMFSCYADFGEVPAQLIRPKAPKDGKRILLERIGFLWNRMGFLYKISFRNIFRYKKRFFMMVLGISGCTALLVAGLGINDSVKNVVNDQYDQVQLYDCSVTFDKEMTTDRQERFVKRTAGDAEDVIFVYHNTADMVTGNREKDVNLVATDDSASMKTYMDLHTVDGEPVSWPKDGEAVICNNLADDYDIAVGDKITLRDEDMKLAEVTVSGVYENFVYNYVLTTPKTLADGWDYEPAKKTAYVHLKADKHDDAAIHQAAANIMDLDRVVTVTVNNDLRNRVNNMMASLNYVIILVVVCAGALAFIVLYNLTNINITERIREIATIKVLGFFPKETSAYVFRENIFLTAISALVGLGLGKWLLAFIVDQIQVDLMCFKDEISLLSYTLAFFLTFVFSALVSAAMYGKLEKISMTESLKSIE